MTEEIKENCTIVIFGATGDLMKRKLVPALYRMYQKGIIDNSFPILGIGRRPISKDQFIDLLDVQRFIPDSDSQVLTRFLGQLNYFRMDFTGDRSPSDLSCSVREIEKKYGCSGNRMFYLAIPPSLFQNVVEIIEMSKLLENKGWIKLVLEKPFGFDLASAKKLNRFVKSSFREEQIYRIDHYLAKELVQDIMVFRFANSLFEQVWNGQCIDNVQITVAESIGIEERGRYYDKAGAIRDMLQNHILQVLSLVAMEPPGSIDADSIRDEKVKILKSLQPLEAEDLVVGQYDEGYVDGEKVVSYRMEPNVDPASSTETFVAAKIQIDNDRWSGIPFYVRTGKRLQKRYSEINLVLRDLSEQLFTGKDIHLSPNIITIRIQPDEGMVVTFNTKYPGEAMRLKPVIMDFCHTCEFALNSPTAYETLLAQIMLGDQILFTRWDGVETSWEFIEPIFGLMGQKKQVFPRYRAGSFGPKEADGLPVKDGRRWVLPKEMIQERQEHKIFWEG